MILQPPRKASSKMSSYFLPWDTVVKTFPLNLSTLLVDDFAFPNVGYGLVPWKVRFMKSRACSWKTGLTLGKGSSINQCQVIQAVTFFIPYRWTPKPWKMQVLNLQYVGYNPERMKVTWVNPMVGTVVTPPLISKSRANTASPKRSPKQTCQLHPKTKKFPI